MRRIHKRSILLSLFKHQTESEGRATLPPSIPRPLYRCQLASPSLFLSRFSSEAKKGVHIKKAAREGEGDLNIHTVSLMKQPLTALCSRVCALEKREQANPERTDGAEQWRLSVVDFELPDWSFTILFILSPPPTRTPPPPQTDLE